MPLEIQTPFQLFFDNDGKPLEDGYIYIGAQNLNPETDPILVYWDAALSIPAAQPIRTLNGYPSRVGTPARLFVNADRHSISVKNKNGVLMYSDLNSSMMQGAAQIDGGVQIVDTIAELRALKKDNPSQAAFVNGYYAAGDGGGGNYYHDASDTLSADNGGTIIVATDGGRWKLIHDVRVSIKQFGAKGDGATADDAIIQIAIDTGIPLYAPEGVYALALSQAITLEAGPTVCALVARSFMNIVGDGPGKSVFKIKDGESTDLSPKFFNMIATNQAIQYVYLDGITFDLNGQNNPISPNRGSGTYNPYNCAALMASGSVATGGADASLSYSKIMRCEVINSPGVTGIGLGQRFGHPGVKGRDVEIASCRFYNNGIDSADHSSIYGFVDGLSAHDNVFDHPTPSTGKGGPVACIESFGSGNKLFNNRVRNYLQFCWVGCGEEGQHSDIQVYGNSGSVSYRFLDTWSFSPQDDGLADIHIFGNQFVITDATLGTPGLDRVAVNLVMNVADLFRVNITGNKFLCTDRSSNAGIVISAGSGHIIGNVSIIDNEISGFSRAVAGGGAGQLLDISVDSNKIYDCHVTTARPSDTRGVDFTGTNTSCTLFVANNDISGGDLFADPLYGVVIAGSFASLHVDANAIRATNDLAITAAVTGRRTGVQALQFNALPTDGTWRIGDEIYNNNRVELGTVGSKYIIEGWHRTTNGTSNTATDWLQRRVLTGN